MPSKLKDAKEVLEFIATPLALGFIVGMMFMFALIGDMSASHVKTEIESYKESIFDELYYCKVLTTQYEFSFDLIETEFNISGQLMALNRTEQMELYQRNLDRYETLADELKDLEDRYGN